ncbi:MAG: hypothetical protein EXX96DRAFT_471379 [Benjaminiella poitrasii]|nr:MAG: hypothetical protein EXX96DRAFT_471379 [Benjaminiella poitrasii]
MPYCRCGELCLGSKCKKCGFNFQSSSTDHRRIKIDRWQARYLNVIGMEGLISPVNNESNLSPVQCHVEEDKLLLNTNHTSKSTNQRMESKKNAPLKSITNSVLGSGRISANKVNPSNNNCGKCNKKLSGKTVRLPDSQAKYHQSCLTCKECNLPFEEAYFFTDPLKNVYHPKCAPSNTIVHTCSRCSHSIIGNYITISSLVLHPRCFRCTGCQKVLTPSSIYIDMNGSYCQSCSNKKLLNDKETHTKHIKIVPQLQKNITAVSNANIIDTLALHTKSNGSCNSPFTESTVTSPITLSGNSSDLKAETVKPSSLMSSRGRPLPLFGIVRECAGCKQRIHSVHEEIPGPKASKWHRKCLACKCCSKILDSGATVRRDEYSEKLVPWCTTCLVNNTRLSTHFV